MAKAGQRKCMSCGEFFVPDHRKGERQRYCCAADCRRASKAASQASWLAKPPNHDYFSGPELARVQAWRDAHPGYSRGRVRPSRALQDPLPPQVPDLVKECADGVEAPEMSAAGALQDLLNGPPTIRACWIGKYSSRPLRINGTASDALFTALGMPAGRTAAPLTASSLMASYLGTAGPGTVNRTALAWMENNNANLIGAWVLGSATDPQAPVFFFFANCDYVRADPQGDTAASRCGGAGYERGTFSFDAGAGTLRALTNSVDSNGCAGLHGLPTASEPFATVPGMQISPDGRQVTFTWSDGSGVDTLFRLTK